MRLLIVEDNQRLGALLTRSLEGAGFAVDCSPSLEEATLSTELASYDAIVLDLGLPDGDGMELLRGLRKKGNTVPVLVLTARDSLSDRVRGLDAGADDYVLKPFEMEELVARIRALLRRPGAALGRTLSLGSLQLDTVERELMVRGEPVALARRELSVLELLLRRAGRVVSKEALDGALYGFGENVSSNSIEVAVHRLRRKLAEANAGVHVHTLRGIGYMLVEDER